MAEKDREKLSREDLVQLVKELEEQNLSLKERIESLETERQEEAAEDPEECADEDSESDSSDKRKKRAKDYLAIVRNVGITLLVTASVVVLVVYFAFPVVRIYGNSMSATLVDGDIVIAHRTTKLDRGDICAFSSGNRVLCKRVIGLEGDVVDIDKFGTVSVNGEELVEPYLKGKSLGECNIDFPYTVPEGCYFVLGDNRRVSIDSRHTVIGCVSEEQMVGKLEFCILPFPSFGKIK